ncbi:MAG: hypothetical protein K0B14_04295 [Anaerolineaceae bacterium]|nr:hypothetical protein [Anaerolineaceae bacterium]
MNKQSLFPEQVFDVPAVSVRISLLGGFRLQCGEQSLTEDQFHLRKARDLLKLLALAPNHRLHREEVLDLLWPEQAPQQAAHNLSQTLYTLRPNLTALDTCIRLAFDEDCLFLLPTEGISTDVEEFEKAARSALSRAGQINNLILTECKDAILLYSGDLLPDDGPSDLFYQRREQLRQLYVDLLLFFAHANLELNSFTPAIQALQQVVEIDPAHEEANFQLMRAFALNDQRQAALRQYQFLTDALRSELGVEPSPESTQLRDQIQKGEMIVAHHRMARKIGKCPYRGLFAFQEVNAPFYFGRMAFVAALEEAIQAKKLVVAIVGSSGSGKSSVLYAGLFPRLRKTGEYQLVTFRPGNQPFYALADALIPIIKPGLTKSDRMIEIRNLAEHMVKGEVSLQQIIKQYTEDVSSPQQLLLVIDQFEELYTLCPDVNQQQAFVDELLVCVDRKDPGMVMLIALRADFMGQALAHRPFADTLQEASLLMGPLNREELRLAIEKPAELQGAAFEPGLVERILDDVGEKPGNLPLLEFTLTQLWEQQTDGWLTHSDYEAMGGVEGALATYADQVYADLGEEQCERARWALVQLVQPGEGTEDTRRIATREELGEESWQLIQHLADKRLVVTGRDAQERETAEVVHEALIRKWGQFQEWMESDRSFRAWQEQLRTHLRSWQESNQDEGALLHGVPLGVAQTWLGERGEQISQMEKEYIDASLALQARLQRERNRRRKWTVVGLVGGLVIAILLAAFALIQRSDAQKERQNALIQASIGLASQAQLELNGSGTERSVLLALEALKNFPYTWQAEKALGQIVREFRLQDILSGHRDTVLTAAWSPDGSKLASSGYDGTLRIWDGITHIELSTIKAHFALNVSQAGVSKLAWSSDSTRIATAGIDRYAKVWDVQTGKEIVTFNGHYDILSGIAWSPDGNWIVSTSKDGGVKVWDAHTGEENFSLVGHAGYVMNVDWSPDGLYIATAGDDDTARIWDATTGVELHNLSGHTNWVWSVDWSPDGNKLATASEDGTVRIWDALTGVELSDIRLANPVWQAAWSPDGLNLATTSASGLAQVWNVSSGKQIFSLQGITEEQFDIAWSPDGKSLVTTGGKAASVRIWNALPHHLTLPDGPGQAWWVSWSPNGSRIAVVYSFERTVIIWDSWTGEKILTITGHTNEAQIEDAWWSPDGSKIVTTGWGNLAKIWDANTGEELLTYTGHLGEPEIKFAGQTALSGGGWSPDGSKILTSGYSIQVWDANTGKQLTKLIPTTDLYIYARWSPDGKRVASCAPPEVLQIWDATTGTAMLGGYVHNTADNDFGDAIDNCMGVEWSPDGKHILTTNVYGSRATIWDAETGHKILIFKGHPGALLIPAWSPNGMRVATGDTTGGVKVWDAETGSVVLDYTIPVGDFLFQIAWSPDGTRLAGGAAMKSIEIHRVWQTTEELIDYAKECCVFRELTDAERTQFGLD